MPTQHPLARPWPAPPPGYFEPDWVGWTLVNCPRTPDDDDPVVPNWVDCPRLASREVRLVPWLISENRPLQHGMQLEVRLDVDTWLPVRVDLEHRRDEPIFYVVAPLYEEDELPIDITQGCVELRPVQSGGALECTSL